MVSELITFNGGLSTKTSPHLIGRNEAITCENVNLEKGSLYPIPEFEYIQDVDGVHLFSQGDNFISNISSIDDRFYDTFNDVVYWTNNGHTNGIMKYDNTNTGVVADAPDPYPQGTIPVTITEVNTDNVRLTVGAIYTYALTVTNADGVESTPVFIEAPTLTAGKTLKLSVNETDMLAYFASNPGHYVNVYRQGGSNPTYNLIIDNLTPDSFGVYDDGLNISYDDVIADINVSRIELATYEHVPAPDDLDMLIEVNGTFWGSVDNKVYFSKTGSPLYWSALDYVKLDKPCTGIGKFADNVVAFTTTSAYLISGYNRDNISLQRLPFNQGCTHKHSIANIDAYLLWTSKNGICMFDGSTVQILTKKTLSWDEFGRVSNATFGDYDSTTKKWNTDSGFDIEYAVGFQDKYYGVYTGGIMILDLSEGLKVSTMPLDNTKSLVVNLDDNILYACVEESNTYKLYSISDTGTNKVATWKTGQITEGSINVDKHYREIEIEGTPQSVEVFIDGVSKYTAYNKSRFMLPPGLYGSRIQFEIKTTNEIKGLKYHYSQLKA